jgi:hypothetical protein
MRNRRRSKGDPDKGPPHAAFVQKLDRSKTLNFK